MKCAYSHNHQRTNGSADDSQSHKLHKRYCWTQTFSTPVWIYLTSICLFNAFMQLCIMIIKRSRKVPTGNKRSTTLESQCFLFAHINDCTVTYTARYILCFQSVYIFTNNEVLMLQSHWGMMSINCTPFIVRIISAVECLCVFHS